jgi:hypothetical protein
MAKAIMPGNNESAAAMTKATRKTIEASIVIIMPETLLISIITTIVNITVYIAPIPTKAYPKPKEFILHIIEIAVEKTDATTKGKNTTKKKKKNPRLP